MKMNTILFPTDFSPTGRAALGFAAALARDMEARLLIVYVKGPRMKYHGRAREDGSIEPLRHQLGRLLRKVIPSDGTVSYEHRIVSGDPVTSIVELAHKEGAGLIVMGTHGRSGISRLLMGSVTEGVVRTADCPVVTFRQPTRMPMPEAC
jgi:nucleotide-binding universal stress UspA family protein